MCWQLFLFFLCSFIPLAGKTPFFSIVQKLEQKKPLLLQENLYNGKILKLSDETLWEVAPQDLTITRVWLSSFPVEVKESGQTPYPFFIINQQSQTKVLVRPL